MHIGAYTTSKGLHVLCESDCPIDDGGVPLQSGRATLCLHDDSGEDLGTVWMKLRPNEFVLSKVNIKREREGIGTGLVEMLLGMFPDHLISGEAPNSKAVAWHQYLESKFPTSMIRFTEHEILQNASKTDVDSYFAQRQ